MEKRRRDRSQSGQILILLVLALAGILGFTALAIDGAVVYSDRRIAQNGADAASISGAQAVTEDLLALGENASYLNWDCYTLQAQGVLTTGNTAAINHAAKVEAFSGGKWTAPVVVRAPCGGGYGDGGSPAAHQRGTRQGPAPVRAGCFRRGRRHACGGAGPGSTESR